MYLALFGFFLVTCPTFAQEVYVHGGATSRTDSSNGSYAWGLTYLQGLHDYAAWSLTYLNEGHIADHKRDGLSPQLWGRYPLFNRQVSLAAGIGPYLYYDTVTPSMGNSYSNGHGVGTMLSISATLYTESRFLLQARTNWVWTAQNVNTYSTTLGVGYQFEKVTTAEVPAAPSHLPNQLRNNEVTLSSGTTILNEWTENRGSVAGSLEYRRNFGRYFDWTVGWLFEGNTISRNGPMAQFWVGRTFFDDQLSLGAGAGPYLGFDASAGNDVTKLNWLVSATASYRFDDHWALRFTWSRVTTNYDRDTDIFLSGISYRF
jgi:hypothetical protein